VRRDLLVSQMRDEVPLVEQLAAAGFRLREYRGVRNGRVLFTPLKQLFRRILDLSRERNDADSPNLRQPRRIP
jgi:hypothetical protein